MDHARVRLTFAAVLLAAPVAAAPLQPLSASAFPSAARLIGAPVDPLESLVTEGEDLHDSVAQPGTSALQAGLRSPSALARVGAIRAAAVPREVASVPYLSGVLLRYNETAQVRAAAALALGRIGDRVAVGALSEALNDPAQEVRYAAALSLGRLPADGVATRLEKLLRTDVSWQVRYAAVIALGRTRKAFVGPALADALENDASWQVRQQAASSLQEIGTPRALEALTAALRDDDASVRAAAGTSLAEIPGPFGRRAIAAALREEQDPSVRSLLALAERRALARP